MHQKAKDLDEDILLEEPMRLRLEETKSIYFSLRKYCMHVGLDKECKESMKDYYISLLTDVDRYLSNGDGLKVVGDTDIFDRARLNFGHAFYNIFRERIGISAANEAFERIQRGDLKGLSIESLDEMVEMYTGTNQDSRKNDFSEEAIWLREYNKRVTPPE